MMRIFSTLFSIFNLWAFIICNAVLAQNLKVPADITAESIILNTPGPETCDASNEGKIYYKSDDKKLYYCDGGASWKPFGTAGGPDKYLATRIVSVGKGNLSVDSLGPYRADIICNGTKADNEFIQDAINLLGSNGGVVYLLEGTYDISAPITLDNVSPIDSNKSIIGSGSATVLRHAGASYIIIVNDANNVLISQLSIDGNNAADIWGIYLKCSSSVNINKLTLRNVEDSNHAIYARCCSGVNIKNNSLESNGCDNIRFDDTAQSIISGNNFIPPPEHYDAIGIGGASIDCAAECSAVGPPLSTITDATGNIISDNICNGGGINLWAYGSRSIVSGNIILNDASTAINLGSSDNNTITGNIIISPAGRGVSASSNADSNVISHNVFRQTPKEGLWLATCKNNLIYGNTIIDSGGSSDISGIKLESGDDYNLIVGNRIFDSAPTGSSNTNYGIYIASSTCDHNYLSANLIDGPGYFNGPADTGADFDRRILDYGTQTKYTDKTKLNLSPGTYTPNPLTNNSTLTPNQPTSYLQITGSTNPTTLGTAAVDAIAGGSTLAVGSILILENTSANNIIITDNRNVQLQGVASRTLGRYDTITLFWNGTDWVEIGFSDNAAS